MHAWWACIKATIIRDCVDPSKEGRKGRKEGRRRRREGRRGGGRGGRRGKVGDVRPLEAAELRVARAAAGGRHKAGPADARWRSASRLQTRRP